MGHIIKVNLREIDFESAVDEVDFIVPKYLAALDQLETEQTTIGAMEHCQRVQAYWKRLKILMAQIAPLEVEIPFAKIIGSCLKSELAVMEKVFIRFKPSDLALSSANSEGEEKAALALSVLERMDAILEEGGFMPSHQDRLYLKTLQESLIAPSCVG